MTLAMCSGVETIANFNHRPLYRDHGAVVVACLTYDPGHVFWYRNNSKL